MNNSGRELSNRLFFSIATIIRVSGWHRIELEVCPITKPRRAHALTIFYSARAGLEIAIIFINNALALDMIEFRAGSCGDFLRWYGLHPCADSIQVYPTKWLEPAASLTSTKACYHLKARGFSLKKKNFKLS